MVKARLLGCIIAKVNRSIVLTSWIYFMATLFEGSYPKLVHNCCIIEYFCNAFALLLFLPKCWVWRHISYSNQVLSFIPLYLYIIRHFDAERWPPPRTVGYSVYCNFLILPHCLFALNETMFHRLISMC